MTALGRRLIVYYATLAAVAIVVVVVVFAAGKDEKTQPSIAGGYDVAPPAAACTGPQMDVSQSGQFVGLRKPDGTVISRARLRDGRLRGDVRCAGGGTRPLVATVAVKGVLGGTLGGAPLRAELKRDPPPPGALRPRPPPSIAGIYKLSPRSDCLGGAFELDKAGGAYELKGGLGRLVYRDGPITGRVTCRDKSVRTVTGQALNRDLTLSLAAGGAGSAPEKVAATKQRDFTKTVAAFFLAVVVVMLFARLMGAGVARFGQPRVMGEVLAGILLGPTVLGARRARPAARDLPARRHPDHRHRGQPRADLLHVPGRPRARPLPAARAPGPDRGDLQHRRRHPDDRRASPSRCRPTR